MTHALTSLADPLERYRCDDSVLFASSRHTLLTSGTRAVVGGDLAGLPGRLDAALGAGDVAAGVVGFDGQAHLIVPESVSWSAPPAAGGPAPRRRWWLRPVPEPEEYLGAVRQALHRMETGRLSKTVLARTLEARSPRPVDVGDLVRPLLGHGYAFAAPLPGGGALIGASPELLVARRGRSVAANPLAGSAARSADPAEDRRRAERLAGSVKDLHEHRLVVEAVADALRPHCRELVVPAEPELTSTGTMWHLSTQVIGELRDPGTPVSALAAALHPTPAVCGTPAAEARRVIGELEPFDRGFYAGLVGWTDAHGDGEWAVAIRCAEVRGDTLRLYAGAGIVPGSDPERELAETSAKFRTMLAALGADADALA